MSTFKERLEIEKEELDTKIKALSGFIQSENFSKIDSVQQILLKAQLLIMTTYSVILNERLNLL